jgi:hypothetical protein
MNDDQTDDRMTSAIRRFWTVALIASVLPYALVAVVHIVHGPGLDTIDIGILLLLYYAIYLVLTLARLLISYSNKDGLHLHCLLLFLTQLVMQPVMCVTANSI